MEELLTVTELALKLKVSVWTIRAWCSQKFVPFIKLRGAVRFRGSEIEKWLNKSLSAGRGIHRLKIEEGIRQN